jgi:hypothetical protein
MGIENINVLFPEGFPWFIDTPTPEPEPEPDLSLVLGEPDSNGVFTISGFDDVVVVTGATTFRLVSPLVTDNGDGTYTANTT